MPILPPLTPLTNVAQIVYSNGQPGYVFNIQKYNNRYYISGSFDGYKIGATGSFVARKSFLVLNGDYSVHSWQPTLDNDVYDTALGGSILYVVGNYIHVNGTARNGIAALDLAGEVLAAWNPDTNGDFTLTPSNLVSVTCKADGSKVYVCSGLNSFPPGSFQGHVIPTAGNRCFFYSLDNSGVLRTGWNGIALVGANACSGRQPLRYNDIDNKVYAIGNLGSLLFGLARFDPDTGAQDGVYSPPQPVSGCSINGASFDTTGTWVTGLFSTFQGDARSGLLKQSKTDGSLLGFNTGIVSHSCNGSNFMALQSLPSTDGVIYATELNGFSVFTNIYPGVAGFDMSSGAVLWNPILNSTFLGQGGQALSFGTNPGDILVGGNFTDVNGVPIDSLAIFARAAPPQPAPASTDEDARPDKRIPLIMPRRTITSQFKMSAAMAIGGRR